MQTEDMIVLEEFCHIHQTEISFVQSLKEYGLVETVITDQKVYISKDELPALEQMIRLYHELHVNPEGIDVIKNLLQRIERMQNEIVDLQNKLHFYEEGK